MVLRFCRNIKIFTLFYEYMNIHEINLSLPIFLCGVLQALESIFIILILINIMFLNNKINANYMFYILECHRCAKYIHY